MKFDYPIEECDVRREMRPQLREFRQCLKQWSEWLIEDEHSIWNQITQMVWHDMVYRTINECRRIAAKDPSPSVGFNWAIAGFIDRSYGATQLLAIRRLTEPDVQGDAITLVRLLDDMKQHANLFTREIYVCHDGLSFNPKPARKKWFPTVLKNSRAGIATKLPPKGPEAYGATERHHRSFDRLIQTAGHRRSRDDRINPEVFGQLKSKLGGCHGISTVASKFIAHAADANSRNKLSQKERSVTMNRIEKCHKAICQVTSYINVPLLYIGSHVPVPLPQTDHLKDLDKAWLDRKHLKCLREFWNKRERLVDDWDKEIESLITLPKAVKRDSGSSPRSRGGRISKTSGGP